MKFFAAFLLLTLAPCFSEAMKRLASSGSCTCEDRLNYPCFREYSPRCGRLLSGGPPCTFLNRCLAGTCEIIHMGPCRTNKRYELMGCAQ